MGLLLLFWRGGGLGVGFDTQVSPAALPAEGATILTSALELSTFFQVAGSIHNNILSPLSFQTQTDGPSAGLCTQFSGLFYEE